MKSIKMFLICLVICLSFLVSCQSTKTKIPKNIIVMIGDGCGFHHILATDYYQYGETGKQCYQSFPVQYAVSTYSLEKNNYYPEKIWSDIEYLKEKSTDSAAAATAISTGVKTWNHMLGVDGDERPVRHFSELCESMDKATGVVTSVQLSHATPAGFLIHHPDRDDIEKVAQKMILKSSADVIMGCGHPWYAEDGKKLEIPKFSYVGGDSVWQILMEGKTCADADGDGKGDAWKLIESRSDFQTLIHGETPNRVLGIPQIRRTLQYKRDINKLPGVFESPLIETVPTLSEMTLAALNVLDNDPDGFFLMVEGGAIDWANHDNSTPGMIEELIFFNQAVESVVSWIESNSSWDETILIITSDHATGMLTGTSESEAILVQNPPVNKGKGNLPGLEWSHDGHTNSLVPLFAKGVGSERLHAYADEIDPVRGKYIDNTEIVLSLVELFSNEKKIEEH